MGSHFKNCHKKSPRADRSVLSFNPLPLKNIAKKSGQKSRPVQKFENFSTHLSERTPWDEHQKWGVEGQKKSARQVCTRLALAEQYVKTRGVPNAEYVSGFGSKWFRLDKAGFNWIVVMWNRNTLCSGGTRARVFGSGSILWRMESTTTCLWILERRYQGLHYLCTHATLETKFTLSSAVAHSDKKEILIYFQSSTWCIPYNTIFGERNWELTPMSLSRLVQ